MIFFVKRLGPIWRNPVKDCQNGTMLNNVCYYRIAKNSNLFDAIDQCKFLGGNLISKSSLSEVRSITERFKNIAPFWVSDIIQFSKRCLVVDSTDHRNTYRNGTRNSKMYGGLLFNGSYSNASLDRLSGMIGINGNETVTKMEGSFLCAAFKNDCLIEINCSSPLLAVCKIPGKNERRG